MAIIFIAMFKESVNINMKSTAHVRAAYSRRKYENKRTCNHFPVAYHNAGRSGYPDMVEFCIAGNKQLSNIYGRNEQ